MPDTEQTVADAAQRDLRIEHFLQPLVKLANQNQALFNNISQSWISPPSLMNVFFKPTIENPRTSIFVAFLILISIVLSTMIIYQTGGTIHAYAYLILLPILAAGSIFKIPGGLLAAFISALALGPLMPLDVANGIMQTTENWLVRMGMFLTIGGFAGALSTLLYVRQQQLLVKERIDPVSQLISPIAAARLCQCSGIEPRNCLRPPYAAVIAFEGLGSMLRTLGVDATNRIIFEVSKSLQSSIGEYALVTRIHGTTFGVFLPQGRETISLLVSRFQERMPTKIPLENFSIILLPRLGVAKLGQIDYDTAQPFRKPLAALQLARDRGKRIARYSSTMDRVAQDRLKLLWDFSQALEQKELSVVFQPKVEIASGQIIGVEALVRWHSGLRGDVSPGYFIPVIEKTVLIEPMTRFVAEESLRRLASWQSNGVQIGLSLNISALLLQSAEFISFLKSLPSRHGVSSDSIEIEITETALMSEMDMMREALIDLHNSGFRIAIDDFGTGYSSFRYLKELPIQTVKLDQSFVRDLPFNKASCEIASAIASMCTRMNYTLVAEGVETQEALDFLHLHGCAVGQGYLYAKPMSGDDFLDWLDNSDVITPRKMPI